MGAAKTDIQIARKAKMRPIKDILAKIKVPDNDKAFSPMGRHIAKINLKYLESLKNKKADICLSAGNTGALLVMSRLLLSTIEGISKPALAALWPNEKSMNVVLDLGANIECNEKNLLDGSLKFRSMILPDKFLDQDTPEEMYKKAGLDSDSIVQKAENVLNSNVVIAKNKNLS